MEQICNETATIVLFPLSRQERLIRETVEVLSKRHGVAADRFWNTTTTRLVRQMRFGGLVDQQEIQTHLEAFAAVVFDRITAEVGAAADQVG